MQKTGKSMNTNKNELKQYLGIQIYKSMTVLPACIMYWSEKTRYAPISDAMSINRYKKLRQFIHVAENLQKNNSENKTGCIK